MKVLQAPGLLLLTIAALWTLFMAMSLLAAVGTITHQRRTDTFLPAAATIDNIREIESAGPAGMSYTMQVRYHYEAGGKRFASTRLRYGERSGPHAWSQEILRTFPEGSHPTIYYDPADPSQSVMLRGAEAADAVGVVFLTPFLLIAILLWMAVYEAFIARPRFPGLYVVEADGATRLRPARGKAYLIGAAVLLAGGIVALAIPGGDSSVSMAALTCAIASLPGVLVSVMLAGRNVRGQRDVIIDPTEQTVTLPNGTAAAFRAMAGVHVISSEKVQLRGHPAFSVALRYKTAEKKADGSAEKESSQDFVIKGWMFDAVETERLATYLALRLKTQAYTPSGRGLIEVPTEVRRTTAPLKPVTTTEVKQTATKPAAAPVKPVHKPFKRTPLPPRS